MTVETPRSEQKGLTPQPREGPVLSAGHLVLAVTVFSIFAEPALPVLRCQEDGDLRRPFVQRAVALECGNSTERYHSCLTRENYCSTRALTRIRTSTLLMILEVVS